ncbi:hypothetical protein WJX74_005007 [Apatococcus lobatus]
MYVPSDSFGGRSPERKAADALCNLFTFCAARVVQAQLEPTAAAGYASYNAAHYTDLMHHLHEYPIKDGNEWLARLMRKNQMLAVRIMEVRKAYSADDFEWEMCKSMANDKLNAGNAKLMQNFAMETFEKAAKSTETPS